MNKTLPQGWRRVRLGEVLEQMNRFEKVKPDQEYRLLGVRWYVQGVFERERKLGKSIAAKQLNRVEEGDFVYNRLFAWKGSFAVVGNGHAGGYVSGEFPVFRVNSTAILPEFLLRNFSRPELWRWIEHLSTGTTNISRNRWREEQFLTWHISLPPLSEQERIVHRLRALDDALNANGQAIASQVEFRSALVEEFFRCGVPGLHSRFKGSQVGKIPETWKVLPLGSFAEVRAGIALGKHRRAAEHPRPYLRVANVLMDRVDLSEIKQIEVAPDEYTRYQLAPGDVLMVEGHAQISQLGRAALAPREVTGFSYQNHIFRVRPQWELCLPRYLCLFVNARPGRVYFEAVGKTTSGLNTVNSAKVREMPVPLAPIPEQQVICDLIAVLDNQLAYAHQTAARLISFRSVLLQTLLTGDARGTK